MKLRTFFEVLSGRIQSAKDPVGYCRKLGATIGEDCVLKASMLGSEPWLITIGNHVLLAEGVRLLTHDGAGWCLRTEQEKKRMDMWGEVVIGDNVYVGTNAIILPNVHITDHVIIGAGAVVTKDITESGVYVGVPAKQIKSFEEWEKDALLKAHNTYGMTEKERRDYFDSLLGRESKT